MRCPRCEFENMTGMTTCFRCGSVLTTSNLAVAEVHPPRATALQKRLRPIVRWFRYHSQTQRSWRNGKKRVPENWQIQASTSEEDVDYSSLFARVAREMGKAFCHLALSIVPGLPHFLQNRFKEITWYWLVWIFSVAMAIFLYGSTFGMIMTGLAIGIHGGLAAHGTFWHIFKRSGMRLYTMGACVFFIGVIYWSLAGLLFSDLSAGYTTLIIPWQNLSYGDFLLARRSAVRHPLARGTLVLAYFSQFVEGQHYDISYRSGSTMVGQIIALPGETVKIQNGLFYVNGRELPSDRYPVPTWLRGTAMEVVVATKTYFVSTEYGGRANNSEQIIKNACLISYNQVEAKAFIRWFPLTRRGYLKEPE